MSTEYTSCSNTSAKSTNVTQPVQNGMWFAPFLRKMMYSTTGIAIPMSAEIAIAAMVRFGMSVCMV